MDRINFEFTEASDTFTKSLLEDACINFNKIRDGFYKLPGFINYIEANIPEKYLKAVLTKEQNRGLADGSLELLRRKSGELLAELRDPTSKKIVGKINLKEVSLTPDLAQAMTLYAMQMQMAQISKDINSMAKAIEEVRQGQQDDRIAIANSCKQKLIQAKCIKNPSLREKLYLQVISDAENSRNQLMLNQMTTIKFIEAIPRSGWQKLISNPDTKEVDEKLDSLMDGLNTINMVSLVAIMAYYELGEREAAMASFGYFRDFIKAAYFSSPGLVERLDNLDRSTQRIWKNKIYRINTNILELSQRETLQIGSYNEEN